MFVSKFTYSITSYNYYNDLQDCILCFYYNLLDDIDFLFMGAHILKVFVLNLLERFT